MQCPLDNTTLVVSERSGIEIDYCPQCRGVWLDRGEIDKIIERSVPSSDDARQSYGTPSRRDDHDRGDRGHGSDRDREHGDDRDRDHGRGDQRDGRRRGRESWLSNLFD